MPKKYNSNSIKSKKCRSAAQEFLKGNEALIVSMLSMPEEAEKALVSHSSITPQTLNDKKFAKGCHNYMIWNPFHMMLWCIVAQAHVNIIMLIFCCQPHCSTALEHSGHTSNNLALGDSEVSVPAKLRILRTAMEKGAAAGNPKVMVVQRLKYP